MPWQQQVACLVHGSAAAAAVLLHVTVALHGMLQLHRDAELAARAPRQMAPLHHLRLVPRRTWFFPQPAKRQVPGSLMHAIYAATYRPVESRAGQAVAGSSAAAGEGGALAHYFPLAWAADDTSVPAIDVTQSYLDTPGAAAVPGAAVQQVDVVLVV
jgi:hypothetical protein